MDLLRLLVFSWLTALAILSIRQIALGQRSALFVVMVVFWAFNGVPLLLDLIWGHPAYTYPNFVRAAADANTNLIHLVYISLIPVIITAVALPWKTFKKPGEHSLAQPATEPGAPTIGLYFLLILPLLLVFNTPDPSLYLQYAFVADADVMGSTQITQAHSFVNVASILAIIAATALLTNKNEILRQWLTTAPWVFLACYFMGKRNGIALYLVLLAQRLWDLGILKGARIPLYFAGFFAAFALSSIGYQYFIRNISTETISEGAYYENVRLDYGRDHTIRAAIYAELTGQHILSFRGQSLLFDLTIPVPRNLWPQKPYPYAIYMTSYAIDQPPQDIGWGFTTSIFDESIANYGWLGMFTAPFFIGLLCRITDNNRTILLRSLGYILCTLFMVVQLTAFYPLFVVWALGSLWHQQRHRFTFNVSALQQRET